MTFTDEQIDKLRAMYEAADSPVDQQAGYVRQLLATVAARDELLKGVYEHMAVCDAESMTPEAFVDALRNNLTASDQRVAKLEAAFRQVRACTSTRCSDCLVVTAIADKALEGGL